MGLNWKWAITLFWSGIIAAAITPTFAASGPTITTLSSRPDMVSGGDALVRVDAPGDFPLSHIVIKLNGQDITATFHADQAGRSFTGLVSGLKLGANALEVFTNPNGKGQPEPLRLFRRTPGLSQAAIGS